MTHIVRTYGYQGRLPSEARAAGAVLSDEEAVDFELAARRAFLDRDRREEPDYCRFHDFSHDPEDPTWAPSDDVYRRLELVDADDVGTLPQYGGYQA